MRFTVDREGGVLGETEKLVRTKQQVSANLSRTNLGRAAYVQAQKHEHSPVLSPYLRLPGARRSERQLEGTGLREPKSTGDTQMSTNQQDSPALVVLDMSVVGVVGPVRYPPAVVGDHDEGVRQMTFGKEGQERGTTGHVTKHTK